MGSLASHKRPSSGPQLHEMTSAPWSAAQTKASASRCEPRPDARRMGMSLAAGATPEAPRVLPGRYARAGGTVVFAVVRTRAEHVFRTWIVDLQRCVARSDHLSGTGEFGMVDIHTVIDDRDRDAPATGHLMRRFDVGVRVDRHSGDVGSLQVPF